MANAVSVLTLLQLFIWTASSQNAGANTTMIPTPTPVPTPAPGDQPIDPASVDMPSTTPSSITCCYVQSLCNNCSEVYSVNSIVYCCPNCRGMVLVTDLICRCTVPKGYSVPDLKCKLSNEVVGGYVALKPSYYDANGSTRSVGSSLVWFVFGLMICFTL